MNKENIKKALDHFENDEFVDAKDILTKEIRDKKNSFVKDKLGLKGEIDPAPAAKDKEEDTEV